MSRELSTLKQQWGSAPTSSRRSREPVLRFTISVEPVKTRKRLDINTHQYRNRLKAEGRPIPEDCDVCHIVAWENGGANHVHNYIIHSSRVNRALGNRHDDVFAKIAGLEQTKKAVAASMRLRGYTGPSAEELCD
jgi:hypothetical protein